MATGEELAAAGEKAIEAYGLAAMCTLRLNNSTGAEAEYWKLQAGNATSAANKIVRDKGWGAVFAVLARAAQAGDCQELRTKTAQVRDAINVRPQPDIPADVRVGDYPLLASVAWQLDANQRLTALEALKTYERNWRHLDHATMSSEERAFLESLVNKYSSGVLLV